MTVDHQQQHTPAGQQSDSLLFLLAGCPTSTHSLQLCTMRSAPAMQGNAGRGPDWVSRCCLGTEAT